MPLDRYQLNYVVAVSWNDDMAQRFPNADHYGCRQEMRDLGDRYAPFDPPRCHGYHCNRCGAPTGSFGHNDCPDKAE